LHCQLYKTKAMQTQTKRILTFLHILSWILFVGVCIKTGALFFSFIKGIEIQTENELTV